MQVGPAGRRCDRCRHQHVAAYTDAGLLRTTYAIEEVDAFAVYCGDVDRCFYLPMAVVAGKTFVHLRLTPARNDQAVGVTMADDYQFGAIAQLGERLAGSQKVAGSSPASST